MNTFSALSLQCVKEEKQTCLEEDNARDAALSMDGDVQFRPFIQPSHDYTKKGGLWIPGVLQDFTRVALVIFAAGFNERTDTLSSRALCAKLLMST